MLGYLDFLLLGFSGRIGRLTYWTSTFLLTVVQFAVVMLLIRLSGITPEVIDSHSASAGDLGTHLLLPLAIVIALFMWPAYAITAKRWHDRGKSGWWSLIAFVPLIGGLWMLIELGFLGGQPGTNEYGYR